MRFTLLFSSLCFWFFFASGQKPALDTGILFHWPSVEQGSLSPDGQFAGYLIREGLTNNTTLVLKAMQPGWEKRLVGAGPVSYTRDSRRAVFMKGPDTLTLLSLGDSTEEDIPQSGTFQLFSRGNEEFLLYARNDGTPRLIIRSLGTGKEEGFPGAESWLLAQKGQTLLIRQPMDKQKGSDQIIRVDLRTGKRQLLWEGRGSGSWLMDSAGDQVAFLGQTTEGSNSIWYYKTGDDRARPISGNSAGIDSNWTISRLLSFAANNTRLLLILRQKERKPDPSAVAVDVWSYSDAKIQSEQLAEAASARRSGMLAALRLDSGFSLLTLQREGEQLLWPIPPQDYVVFDSTQGNAFERPWSKAAQPRFEVVSVRTGDRTTLRQRVLYRSPGGKFLLLIAAITGDLSTYELATGRIRPVTAGLQVPSASQYHDWVSDLQLHYFEPSGWLPNDSRMILCDLNDVWEIDPLGQAAPLNLTHRYGRDHHILFRPALRFPSRRIDEEPLLLSGFDEETKDNGFYRVPLHREQDPTLLSKGPWLFHSPTSAPGEPVIKAIHAPLYLVRREDASQSPNYFLTRDLKTFTPLSNLYPERSYRWLTCRLLRFTTDAGRPEKGLLYLPEEVDSTRPCPVIIHYYERHSDELHLYHSPDGHPGDLNIPWFTSHGYAVFVTDIHYSIHRPGEGVVQTVEAAARLLKQLPDVKVGLIGIQGHSFGGWETDYLVTHSRTFAAAMSSAGVSDMVSAYTDLWTPEDISKADDIEYRQYRMGATPWEHPEYYIANSPFLTADRVTTPVLLVNNKQDQAVSFRQGLAFFSGLRRLGKPAWMLQYDKYGHGESGPERLDCLLRMTQFFDHYLKSSPAPRWMTRGIPAGDKGIDRGFQLDPTGDASARSLLLTHPDNEPAGISRN